MSGVGPVRSLRSLLTNAVSVLPRVIIPRIIIQAATLRPPHHEWVHVA